MIIYVCGRKVKSLDGTQSQTVNVYTKEGIHGEYDWIIRFREPFVTGEMLAAQKFSSIEKFIITLQRQYHGQVEQNPIRHREQDQIQNQSASEGHQFEFVTGPATARRPVRNQPERKPGAWHKEARCVVENAINQLALQFVRFPYMHRVEHSLHCELFRILTSNRLLGQCYRIGNWNTQPVHKEWPEYVPRPEKGNRRGNFDLAVLTPEDLREASLEDFRDGRIRPAIAIEIGLDYDLKHLLADSAKLKNSGIADSYLVHLVRQEFSGDFNAVESFVTQSKLKLAFVRHLGNRAMVKRIGAAKLEEMQADSLGLEDT